MKGEKFRVGAKRRTSIYAFIDSQNLNLGVRSQGWKLDFAKFRVYLQDKYQITNKKRGINLRTKP